ncbi:S10 family serine carboxypeptidase-like protein [Streptomyces sp. NPDC002536]
MSSTESSGPSDLVASIPANIPGTLSIDFTQKVRSYAGHVHIDSTEHPGKKNHLFYWFFESQTCSPHVSVHDQQELISRTPLLIWLNGGPGASSLLGLFLENGPLSIGDDAAGTVSVTDTTWNQEAHVVYWDQPIGTGYSYSDARGELVHDEGALARMFCKGLQEFFVLHPQYAQCPLYVCGESYAGKYVPAIALEIDKQNRRHKGGQHINLKGISVGNGWIKPELSLRVLIDYAYTAGFLGISEKEALDASFADVRAALAAGDMPKATRLGNALVTRTLAYGGNFDLYDVRRWDDIPMGALRAYLDSENVKKSLHVPTDVTWQCADNDGAVADALVNDNMADASGLYAEILEKGYKAVLYTGNFDTACGYRSTEEILDGLMKQKGSHEHAEWRNAPRLIWTQAQGNPKGFVRRHGNLTQVAVPGSGHQVPAFQPQICREMLYNWLFERPFPGYDPLHPIK